MTFDLSRIRFNARKDFLGVVMQQGRVQLDSDWNEWVAQLLRRAQAGTLDIVGQSAVPRETPEGFAVQAVGGKLTIGPGRIYVDGLLAECHGAKPDSWDHRLAEEAGTAALDYAAQPYRPWLGSEPDLPAGGPHLAYLDVWQRAVTHVQDDSLVEPAVGVDTTGRLQTVWQVKVLQNVGGITPGTGEDDIPGWRAATRPSEGRLSTGTGDPPGEEKPCQVIPQAAYRGLENQLYRVQIHKAGPLGSATFTWSRDNATVVARVTHIKASRDQLTVESVGRDDVLGFHDGDWVEVTDDWRELKNLPGELRRIRLDKGVDADARTITLDSPLTAGVFRDGDQAEPEPGRNTRVRRWDQAGKVYRESGDVYEDLDLPSAAGDIVVPEDGTRLFLENGILVDFAAVPGPGGSAGEFRSGDFWAFAARCADGTVETLAKAPPLGIHHHYARLAIVTFPDAETDCRTLWPPLPEGESCDCSVCVKAECHNSGASTIEQAIDKVKDSGGTVCLGPGTYHIRETIRIDGARSLRVRGQGWRTVLLGDKPGTVLEISGGAGVALENLSVVGGASAAQENLSAAGRARVVPENPAVARRARVAPENLSVAGGARLAPENLSVAGGAKGGGATAAVSVSNSAGVHLDHVNVLAVATGNATSAALQLSGYVLGCDLDDCVLVAERGVIGAGGKPDWLFTVDLHASRNVLFCGQRGFSFEGVALHDGACSLTGNLILGCRQVAVVATGGALPGSRFAVADNVILVEGTGIRGGVDGLSVQGNEIAPFGKGLGDGIVLERGLDPVAAGEVRIVANHVRGLAGNGVAILHRVDSLTIEQNVVSDVGLAGIVMAEGGSAADLVVGNNHFAKVGRSVKDAEAGFAGLEFVAVERLHVLDNVVAQVARSATGAPAIAALLGGGIGEARIAGNRVHGVGPQRMAGSASAVHVVTPLRHLAIDDNTVSRTADDTDAPEPAAWQAVRVGASRGAKEAAAKVPSGGFAWLELGARAFLLTATRVRAFARSSAGVSVRGNRLRGRMTSEPLVAVEGVESCLFAENHCQVAGEYAPKEVQLARLKAGVVNAGNNRLVGVGGEKAVAMDVRSNEGKGGVITLGNISTGRILVNDQPLQPPWDTLNIVGA